MLLHESLSMPEQCRERKHPCCKKTEFSRLVNKRKVGRQGRKLPKNSNPLQKHVWFLSSRVNIISFRITGFRKSTMAMISHQTNEKWCKFQTAGQHERSGHDMWATKKKKHTYFPWNTGCLMTGSLYIVVYEIIPLQLGSCSSPI